MEIGTSEDNLVGKFKEDLGQVNGTPRKGVAVEKGEPKTVRAAQCWLYDLKLIKKFARDKDPLLQHVRPTQIALNQYGLGDPSKGGLGSGLFTPKEVSDGMEDGI